MSANRLAYLDTKLAFEQLRERYPGFIHSIKEVETQDRLEVEIFQYYNEVVWDKVYDYEPYYDKLHIVVEKGNIHMYSDETKDEKVLAPSFILRQRLIDFQEYQRSLATLRQ